MKPVEMGDYLQMLAVNSPAKDLAFTNLVFVSPQTFVRLENLAQNALSKSSDGAIRCDIKSFVFNVSPYKGSDSTLELDQIGLNKSQRASAQITINELVNVKAWTPSVKKLSAITVALVKVELGLILRNQSTVVHETKIQEEMSSTFQNQVLTVGQTMYLKNPSDGIVLYACVKDLEVANISSESDMSKGRIAQGIIVKATEFLVQVSEGSNIGLSGNTITQRNIFRHNFDFEQFGIGGLGKEFSTIFRRVFASRVFPPHVIAELGIQHVRGMLLHGPPGTGKTLLARQIGKALRAKEPKIVNGPEVLNKYVGQSEENIRALFKDAEEDYKKKGDNSGLHIIILDEIDAICKQRGTSQGGAGVNDSVVNQLLSKIDGINSLNNILLIGMTNRLDMIDEALLRPGRLEVHVEIGLPDTEGRLQILKIHTSKMRKSERLASDVSLVKLAEETRNFSGAEIAGLVRNATSCAFTRKINVKDLSKPTDVDSMQITMADFQNALDEIKPAFGVQENLIEMFLLNGIIEYSRDFEKLQSSLFTMTRQVRESSKTSILSALLIGKSGAGKTALAANVAIRAEFPLVKLISPDEFIGFTESAKASAMKNIFENAYKSNLSIIILDCIERLVEYTPFGNRFSNVCLQALLTLVNKPPGKPNHRLFVLGTSSEPSFVEESGLAKSFNVAIRVPALENSSSIKTVLRAASVKAQNFPVEEIDKTCEQLERPIPVKQLLMVYEMASEVCRSDDYITADKFLECLNMSGIP